MKDKAQPEDKSFDEIIAVTDEDIYVVKYIYPKDGGVKNSIIGSVLAIFPILNFIGLYLSIKGYEESKHQGYKGTWGLVGIFLNATTLTILVISTFAFIYAFATAPYDVCSEMGPGSWLYDGKTYTCE